MEEKITLDMLTQYSVSVKKQKYTTVNGVEYAIGEAWRTNFINSIRGREEIKAELAEPYLSGAMAIWGDNPTVEEKTEV